MNQMIAEAGAAPAYRSYSLTDTVLFFVRQFLTAVVMLAGVVAIIAAVWAYLPH